MPSSDDITLGEIWRGQELLRDAVKELTKTIVAKPDWNDLKDTRTALEAQVVAEAASRKAADEAEKAAREAERKVADKAIAALEDWNKWAVRIVLGAAGTGVVGWGVTAAIAAATTR